MEVGFRLHNILNCLLLMKLRISQINPILLKQNLITIYCILSEISRIKYNNIIKNGENISEMCPRSLFVSSSEDHGYDCEAALLRILPKCSTKQKQQVYLIVQRAIAEQSLLPECPNFTQSLITDAPSWKLDTYSQGLLHNFCNGYSTHSPVIVSGDGNCLFNAISYLLSGNESLSTELRLRTVIELSCNTNFI